MADEDARRIADEVEALRAIYGDERVSYGAGAISIALRDDADLSVGLPAGYPSHMHASMPTLRAAGLEAAASALVVSKALREVDVPIGTECVFEYATAVLSALDEARAAVATPVVAAVNTDEAEKNVRISCGKAVTDRKSVFLGEAVRAKDTQEALQIVKAIQLKHSDATHCSWALIAGGDADCDDDGEKGAGRAMLRTLRQKKAANVVVVVSRWFGGVKLGPVRFRHICAATRDALDALQTDEAQTT